MENVFLKLLNMSISAGWVALAVLLLRPLMKRVPRAIHCLLWGLVGLRLIWPFSIESILSLLPSSETVPPEIVYEQSPAIQSGVPAINAVVNPILSESSAANPMASVNPIQIWLFLAAILWIGGMAVMTLYALISYFRIARKVRVRLPLGGKLYACDAIDTPFILGVFRPKIFLPSALDGEDQAYVIAHEEAHLKRRDHWWKPIGFLLLTVYWFNPLMWVAYVLLCRDIEMACDERVIKEMGIDDKKAYSRALLQCSAPRRLIAACPLAFGEVGVARRVRSVLHYKKPAFWIILLALLTSIILAVCFLTDPKPEKNGSSTTISVIETASEYPGVTLDIEGFDPTGDPPTITVNRFNKTKNELKLLRSFSIFYRENSQWVDVSIPQDEEDPLFATEIPAESSICIAYDLSHYDLSRAGKYRFQIEFHVDEKSYKAWADFELSQRKPEESVVLEINSAREGITAEVQGIDLQSEYPYIELKWINETEQSAEYPGDYNIRSEEYGVTYSKYDYSYGPSDPEIPPKGSVVHRYPLYYQWFPGAGTYIFESSPITVEFRVTETVPVRSDQIYAPVNCLYTDGKSVSPCIRLIEYSTGYRLLVQDQNQWKDFGVFEETVLRDYNFDGRFHNAAFRKEGFDAQKLRENNARAWEYGKDGYYHLLLLQKDGSVYYGIGSGGAYGLNPYSGVDDGNYIENFNKMEPVNEVPADKKTVTQLNFIYSASSDDFKPSIQLFPAEQDFHFNYESRYIYGRYERKGDTLLLKSDNGRDSFAFKMEPNALVFDAGNSSPIKTADEGETPVPDGAIFATGTIGTLDDYLPKEGVTSQKVQLYNPIALTFNDGSFSYVQMPGGAPCIRLAEHSEGVNLQIYEKNAWQEYGRLTEITLNEENFDSRFRNTVSWEEKTSAAELRRNNSRAWEVKKQGNLYLVLEQTDGTLYYAVGYYDSDGMVNPNSDASSIRWLYRTEAVAAIPPEKLEVTVLYFTYPDSEDPEAPALNLFLADQSFDFCYSIYSSYLAYGFYERSGNDLILKTKDGLNTYTFKIQGQTLIFDAARSSKIPEYKYSGDAAETRCPVPDGAVFETGMEGETIDDYIPKA